MSLHNPETVHDVDAVALCEALMEAIEGTLRAVLEFDDEVFNVLYAADSVCSYYGSEAAMLEHFEHVHGFVNLDYTEMDLFTDELFPASEDVHYLVSGLDLFTMVRVYVADCSYFVAIDPDEPILPIVRAVERVVRQRA